ncbi:MAG: DUF2332 domain-containing protein [Rubrobacteraceae bacterium]
MSHDLSEHSRRMRDSRSISEMSERFLFFAEECRSAAPIYTRLSECVAKDEEMLNLTNEATSVPLTNLLFGAVHFLLLGGADHELARFYPSLSERPQSGDSFPAFKDFCLKHRVEISRILKTRRVQTNEIRRSALLLPAFETVARRSGLPLALVEVGASAGLNLNFDLYAYDYGEAGKLGEDSPLVLECELRGKAPPLPAAMPEVARRVGIELSPVDVSDEEDARWLLALIWPENFRERAERLRKAVALARKHPPDLRAGDALEILPNVLEELPERASPLVFHTFTVNQFPEKARKRFREIMDGHARKHGKLHEVSIGWRPGDEFASISLTEHPGGETNMLARCDAHGEWIEWLESGA